MLSQPLVGIFLNQNLHSQPGSPKFLAWRCCAVLVIMGADFCCGTAPTIHSDMFTEKLQIIKTLRAKNLASGKHRQNADKKGSVWLI